MTKYFPASLVAAILLSFSLIVAAQTERSAEGLSAKVTVRRDARWIPYIEAGNDADLYFAQGYVVASDRLWQMDLLRRVARGESAEIFGRTTLEEDKRWRRYGFAKVADAVVAGSDIEVRRALEQYARGVNAYIATLTDETLPIEFRMLQYRPRAWTAADSVIIGKILADALSSSYQRDLLQLTLQTIEKEKLADLRNPITPYDVILFGKDTKPQFGADGSAFGDSEGGRTQTARWDGSNGTVRGLGAAIGEETAAALTESAARDLAIRERSLRRIGLFAEELAASNNWVISGKRTADGKPILANDPHLMPSAPGIWYMVHLSAPGIRVAGVTLPGAAGVILGHNENIAWGATNVGPDVQDLYIETFNAEGKFKTPDGWKDPVIWKEEFRIRANPLKPETVSETFEFVETRNGPVIVEQGGRRMSLRWTALDPANREFDAFFHLNRAKDWNEFRSALRDYGGAMQNFIYADTKGNIGWYAAGKIPLRRTGDGSLPYDGSTNEGDWIGTIPFEKLPNLYNPSQGFIMTANQRIVGTDYAYPQLARDFAPPWRARRLFELLSNDTKATMDSSTAAQMDVYNIPLAMLAKEIVAMGAASAENLKLLGDWDGLMTPDSSAALLANEMRTCAANKIAEANKPVPAALIRERILHWAVKERSGRWLPKEFADYAALLRSCNDGSSAAFTGRYGADASKWVWGAVTAARFPHPLAAAPLIGGQFATPTTAIAGSGQTPNVASFVSMRHVASPGNWDETRLAIPLGQSGDPRSPHFKDQFDRWRTGERALFPFSKAAVDRETKAVLVLIPASGQGMAGSAGGKENLQE